MQMMIGEDDGAVGEMKLCVQVNRQPGENVLSGYQWRLCAGEVLKGRMPWSGKGRTRVHGEKRTQSAARQNLPRAWGDSDRCGTAHVDFLNLEGPGE